MPTEQPFDKNNHRILLLSAFEPELAYLIQERPALENRRVNGLRLEFEFGFCGVGSVSAACWLTRRLEQERIGFDEILFIGSAGSYQGAQIPMGAFALASEFAQVDAAVIQGKAHIPEIQTSRLAAVPGRLAACLGRNHAWQMGLVCNSTQSVSLTAFREDELQSQNIHLENLEAFGLAMAAAQKPIPFCALLAVTNLVGPNGSMEWQLHFRNLGRQLNEKFLAALPPNR
ncbi:MAG: hypothetical protein KDK39_06950 [Leptospiraceae bacterium]|nr:hypothetical protein [Leptospiraceae bacterium]